MKKTKIYGVFGLSEYIALMGAGEDSIKVHFKNGSKTTRGIEPARYMTSLEKEQDTIENSQQFKKGKVKLIKTIVEKTDEDLVEQPKVEEAEPVEEVNDELAAVKTVQAARSYLTKNFGATLSELQNKNQVLEYASSKGVVFPNWK